MGKKLVRAKKLYYLILDDESKYCLLKLDVASKDYVELDHDLDLFALSRLLFQQDNDQLPQNPKQKRVSSTDYQKICRKLLCDGISEAMQNWGGFLKMSQKFTTYSFNNTMLIWMQQLQRELEPSSQVAGYKTWQTKFNRQVKKGSKCFRILAPRASEQDG